VDYTARYGALRDEDRATLRTLLGLEGKGAALVRRIESLVAQLGLGDLLDLPAVALSNGQTRRARIIRALLLNPHVLLLDEPLSEYNIMIYYDHAKDKTAGLDVNVRTVVSTLLRDLHQAQAPRVLLGLRAQDPIPEWITHVLDADAPGIPAEGSHSKEPGLWLGSRSAWEAKRETFGGRPSKSTTTQLGTNEANQAVDNPAEALAGLQNIRVSYGDRHVLRGIDWTIRPGERWHLSVGGY
jgi:ABC-type multidrug transport system fused ATPase/permease subunit